MAQISDGGGVPIPTDQTTVQPLPWEPIKEQKQKDDTGGVTPPLSIPPAAPPAGTPPATAPFIPPGSSPWDAINSFANAFNNALRAWLPGSTPPGGQSGFGVAPPGILPGITGGAGGYTPPSPYGDQGGIPISTQAPPGGFSYLPGGGGLGLGDRGRMAGGIPPVSTGVVPPQGGVPIGGESTGGAPSGGTPPTGGTPTGGQPIPPGQPFGYDPTTKTYHFSDGKGGSFPMPEADFQAILVNAGKTAGISGSELLNFMANRSQQKGIPISLTDLSADNAAKIAAAAATAKATDPTSVQPKGGVAPSGGPNQIGPGGVNLGPANMQFPGRGANEYGGAANRYFQQLAFAVNDHSLSEPDSYRAAVQGGFTGDYKSWLITKDQIIHQQHFNRGGGGGGGGGGGIEIPGTPPPGVTPPPGTTPPGEPNIRPFGSTTGQIQYDESDLGALPKQYQSLVQQMMEALGYTSTGFMGQFGERGYSISGTPKPVNDQLLASITSDPTAQAWLKWLAYRKGLLGVIEPYPTTPGQPAQ